eukprot:6492001-Amphidinium_carterae.2
MKSYITGVDDLCVVSEMQKLLQMGYALVVVRNSLTDYQLEPRCTLHDLLRIAIQLTNVCCLVHASLHGQDLRLFWLLHGLAPHGCSVCKRSNPLFFPQALFKRRTPHAAACCTQAFKFSRLNRQGPRQPRAPCNDFGNMVSIDYENEDDESDDDDKRMLT